MREAQGNRDTFYILMKVLYFFFFPCKFAAQTLGSGGSATRAGVPEVIRCVSLLRCQHPTGVGVGGVVGEVVENARCRVACIRTQRVVSFVQGESSYKCLPVVPAEE